MDFLILTNRSFNNTAISKVVRGFEIVVSKTQLMYKLKHFLFGWDYIQWHFPMAGAYGIARVKKLPNGRIVYWRYRLTAVMDEITDAKQVFWLTCPPSKYGL